MILGHEDHLFVDYDKIEIISDAKGAFTWRPYATLNLDGAIENLTDLKSSKTLRSASIGLSFLNGPKAGSSVIEESKKEGIFILAEVSMLCNAAILPISVADHIGYSRTCNGFIGI